MDDVSLLTERELRSAGSIADLRKHLYGSQQFPILLPSMRARMVGSARQATEVRRQYSIERVLSTCSVTEYREMASGLAKRGLMGNIQDTSLRRIWTSWQQSVTDRLSESFAWFQANGSTDQVHSRFTSASRKAMELLVSSGLKPETISLILCVSSTAEICNPDASRSTITGRGGVDLDSVSSDVRRWTTTDIESSVDGSGIGAVGGRALVTHLADIVGSSVMFEANCSALSKRKPTSAPIDWSVENRLVVGSELVRILLSECMVPVDASVALNELRGITQTPNCTGPNPIDPEQVLFSSRPPTSALIGGTANLTDQVVQMNAFQHVIEDRGLRSTGYVVLRPELVQCLASVVPKNSFYRLPPLVIPPLRWKGFWECGYLTRRSPLIRFTGTKDGARDSELTDLSRVRASMDYLGSTKWRVNGEIVDLIDSALTMTDRDIPGIPSLAQAASAAESLAGVKNGRAVVVGNKMERRTDLLRRLKDKQKLENELPILMSKLETAREFKNAPAIFFPHSVDFRGRAYPISAPFNHQGDDLGRSMLRIGESRRLGERGWFWLRIHCANLMGKDKLPFEERLAWIDGKLEVIESVVRKDPLGEESVAFIRGETDDFWQALAACLEIGKALSHPGGPEEFLSSLPVHQDGSCNGLQHYAALGRDELGALAVNIKPSEKVEDVYSVVLSLVKQRVEIDAADIVACDAGTLYKKCPAAFKDMSDNKAVLAKIALMTDGVLARKTVKQTVMTICYGVTTLGASDQVLKQLSDLPSIAKSGLSSGQQAVLASYLARLTLSSIDTVFNQAMEIKRWFDQVSREINKHKLSVNWISPAGLPCRQPYRKCPVTEIRTPLQKISVMTETEYDKAPVSGAKQRMGFPPNYIHSLDASHMILTSLECKKAGIVFAAVHDSFWTHACDVDTMNDNIRQEFYAMYQEPILERLRDSIVASLGKHGNSIPELPKQGTLDLKCVLKSPYFFD